MLIFAVNSLLLTTWVSGQFVAVNYNSAEAYATFTSLSFEVPWWNAEKKDSSLPIQAPSSAWDSTHKDGN